SIRIGDMRRGQQLNRHSPVKPRVEGAEHLSHAADADFFNKAVMSKRNALQVRPRRICRRDLPNAAGGRVARKCWFLDEARRVAVMRQQRLHLAAQFLISGARFLDYRAAPAFVRLESLLKNAFDFAPSLRFHRISFRSVRALTTPWLTANPAQPCRVKPSILPPFLQR